MRERERERERESKNNKNKNIQGSNGITSLFKTMLFFYLDNQWRSKGFVVEG